MDRKYLAQQPAEETWSTLFFQQERPPRRDFNLWQRAVLLLASRGRPDSRLGRLVAKGHKIWHWQYNLEKAQLYHTKGAVMDIYTAADGHARWANKWRCTIRNHPQRDFGVICSVRNKPNGEKTIICYTDLPPPTLPPTDFWEVLHRWQQIWLCYGTISNG